MSPMHVALTPLRIPTHAYTAARLLLYFIKFIALRVRRINAPSTQESRANPALLHSKLKPPWSLTTPFVTFNMIEMSGFFIWGAMVGMCLFKTCAFLQLLFCAAMNELPVDDAIPEPIFDLTPQQIDWLRNMLTLTVPFANITPRPTDFLPISLSSSLVKK